MQKIVSARYQTSFLRRYLMLAFLVVMGYLCQVCVSPYCSIASVAPNLLYVVIGFAAVSYICSFFLYKVFSRLITEESLGADDLLYQDKGDDDEIS